MGRAALPVLALVALMATAPARAGEVARSDDGVVVVEASGFYKPYASWLVMPPALVESVSALGEVVEEARASLPPEAAAALPVVPAFPAHVGLSTHTARVQGRVLVGERWSLEGRGRPP